MRKLLLMVVLAAALLSTSNAAAATVSEMSFSELVESSAYVFTGTVVDKTTEPSPTDPLTFVTFEVEDELMGNQNPQITYALPEGPLGDGRELDISGAPHFVEGHTYLVFAQSGDWSLSPVTNWMHSVFREVSIDGERYFVDQSGHGITDISDQSGFITGPMLQPTFTWETNPDDPDTGIRSRVNSHQLSDEEISENASISMTVNEVLTYLDAELPSEAPNPTISFEPAQPLSETVR